MIPGLGRSAGERNGYPLQYFGLENSNGVAKSRTQLRDFHKFVISKTGINLIGWIGGLNELIQHADYLEALS